MTGPTRGLLVPIRNDLSHRGKGSVRDPEILNEAFIDVHDVARLLCWSLYRTSPPHGRPAMAKGVTISGASEPGR